MSDAQQAGQGGSGLRSCGKTDIGRKRKNNQDAILLNQDAGYFVLADGMGGHLGGEEASRLATEVVSRVFSGDAEIDTLSEDDAATLLNLSETARLTRLAALAADSQVMSVALQRRELHGMGATLETLFIRDGVATIGHVGDSRVYRMRGGSLEQVTEDHSVLNEELKRRSMTPEEIESFPFKNRIIRALGHLEDRRVDIIEEPLRPGDLYLLCSDGLTEVVDDSTILDTLAARQDDLPACCGKLVELANGGGGPDNISVIVVAAD